ncbi:UbiA prenyltransferase family-domain-containing protein [Xylariaceae sp. FL0662B]|nr:UbiA prenyltransferase family-domain-containing protein [Xylariaceae sp. FL0662B]
MCTQVLPSMKPLITQSGLPRKHRSTFLQNFSYHMHTAYLFSCNNLKDIVCMGYLFGALNATIADRFMMGPALTITQILKSSPSMLLWSWSNLLIFNLHNQRHAHAISEDAVNKPWRPLPSGRLTIHQATRTMYCMYPVILIVSSMVGGLVPCLLEAVFCLWYNEWGGSSDPFLKNILNGFGFACFYSGPLEIVTGRSVFAGEGRAAIWVGILAITITASSHLQDFRDMEGDRAVGRRTVPLVIGDMNARLLCILAVALSNGAACSFWEVSWRESALAWAAGLTIGGNLVLDKSIKGDVFTWKLFPLWVLGLFLLPIVKI